MRKHTAPKGLHTTINKSPSSAASQHQQARPLSTDTASLRTHEAEVHQPVDLLRGLVVVEVVELGALSIY